MSTATGLCGVVLEQLLAGAAVWATAGMAEALFYGIHCILFALCLFLIFQKRRFTQWPILLPAIAMFMISTVDIALTFRFISWILPRVNNATHAAMAMKFVQGKDTLFVASNCVAEFILLYRCYTVWDRSKYVLLLVVFVVADTVWGFVGMGPITVLSAHGNRYARIYVSSLFTINVVLTLITVTRIIYMSKFSKGLLGQHRQVAATYHTAIAILVETSVVYSMLLLIYLVYPISNANRIYIIVIAMRVVGIMPTLLIVQVGLGGIQQKTKAPTTLSKFQVGTRPNSVVLDALATSMSREDGPRVMLPNVHDEEADIALTVVDERPKMVFEPFIVEVRTENSDSRPTVER